MTEDKKCLNCSRMTVSQDEYISGMQDKIHALEKENAELKKDKEYLDNTNNEQTEVILKLNEQIEKMKCCVNCKHAEKGYELCNDLKFDKPCKDFDHWELAE